MKRILLFAFAYILSAGFLSAEQPKSISINSIIVEYTGKIRTNENALRNWLDIEEGQIFADEEELFASLETQERLLTNTRYYKSVKLSAELISDNNNEYEVIIHIEDGLTLVPIPYVLPQSSIGSYGTSFGIEFNYDNFFGSMTDFFFDASMDFAFGEAVKLKDWEINPGLKNIKIGNLIFSAEFIQHYGTTKETDPALAAGLQLLQHYTNHESFLEFETLVDLRGKWSYTFIPQLGMKYSFDYHDNFEGDIVQENNTVIEDRFNLIYEHNISYGQIDWVGPLRTGYNLTLTNALKLLSSYSNLTASQSLRFVSDFDFTAQWYIPLGDRFNYYSQGSALVIFNNEDTGLGSRLRGVDDSSMSGNLGFFWSNTMAFEVWGNDTIHLQIHPFADLGIALNTQNVRSFRDLFRIGFGTEVIVMLGSIDLNARLGYDPISDYLDISFGTGLTF